MHRTARIVSVALAAVLGLPALVHAVVVDAGNGGVITFTKSVGTDPTCAIPTSQVGITVAPGTNVTYCYVIEGSKDVTITLEELDDDQLGTLFPPPAPLVLPPLTPYLVKSTVPIFRTTLNTATWNVEITDTTNPADTFSGIVFGKDTVPVGPSAARVSVPTGAKAPTLSGAGLALVALALLMVGAVQLRRGRGRSAGLS